MIGAGGIDDRVGLAGGCSKDGVIVQCPNDRSNAGSLQQVCLVSRAD
jgi:hypothetical protein